MFDSFPAGARPRLILEPWATDYGSAIDFDDDEDPDAAARPDTDAFVETRDWSAGITPHPLPLPHRVAFVDGVQRTESFARIDTEDDFADAALASVAAGAVIREGTRSTIDFFYVSRVLAVAGTAQIEPLVITHPSCKLIFEIERSLQTGRHAAFQAVAVRRRNLERLCVQRALTSCDLVIADGRLETLDSGNGALVGIAKTLHQRYLQGEQLALIPRLQSGERTPVFLIKDSWGSRYSWFVRLPYTRAIHHNYAGIVRLETPEDGPVPLDLVDMITSNLPRFASRPEHDPRAPQNLLPIGALEKGLRHEMGDPRFLRRLIEDSLFAEIANA